MRTLKIEVYIVCDTVYIEVHYSRCLFLPEDLITIWVQNIENNCPLYGCVSILCGYLKKLDVFDMNGWVHFGCRFGRVIQVTCDAFAWSCIYPHVTCTCCLYAKLEALKDLMGECITRSMSYYSYSFLFLDNELIHMHFGSWSP